MACDFLIEKIGKDQIGDYLEFGVSHGSSISIMHQVLKKSNLDQARLFGFDSFEGMPPIAAYDDDGLYRPGQFASSLEATKNFMTRKGVDWSRTFLTKGWFSDTLTPDFIEKHKIKKAVNNQYVRKQKRDPNPKKHIQNENQNKHEKLIKEKPTKHHKV